MTADGGIDLCAAEGPAALMPMSVGRVIEVRQRPIIRFAGT